MTFRARTIDKWSAHEVQEVLNNYHAEMCFKAAANVQEDSNVRVALNRMEVSPIPVHLQDDQKLVSGTEGLRPLDYGESD